MYWIEFIISAGLIIFAGARLTTYTDLLSDQLNIGKLWLGVVLLGFVTSLPEAITSIISVVSLQANDLAIGNMLGSNIFNPIFVVVLDLLCRQRPIAQVVHVKESHGLSVGISIILTLIVIADIYLSSLGLMISWGRVSLGGMLIAVIYFLGMRRLSSFGKEEKVLGVEKEAPKEGQVTGKQIWINLLFSAILVVVGAMWLAKSADTIALQTNLGRTFVGSIFLALATSLPELVVTISAFRLGTLDLAIGNIFGSNMTNIFIVFVCSLFHADGPILADVSITHIFTAVLGMVMTAFALTNISLKKQKLVGDLSALSIVMILFFMLGTFFQYLLR